MYCCSYFKWGVALCGSDMPWRHIRALLCTAQAQGCHRKQEVVVLRRTIWSWTAGNTESSAAWAFCFIYENVKDIWQHFHLISSAAEVIPVVRFNCSYMRVSVVVGWFFACVREGANVNTYIVSHMNRVHVQCCGIE